MKAENNRLGRCSSCRYWRSASDLVSERAGTGATADVVEAARAAVRRELTQDLLAADQADYRGWCTAAEQAVTEPCTMMAVHMAELTPARMITLHDFGCIDYQPRPRRAMNAPPPDFSRNPKLGRCIGCKYWSSAENESNARFASARYDDPNVRFEDCQREALALLSPLPLDPAIAMLRGWCKAASEKNLRNKCMAYDPLAKAVGGLITTRDYACTRYVETSNPGVKTKPDWRWMANRNKLHNFGPSASINELLLAHLDPATLMDESHPLSPLHQDHPLNIRNVKSLYYNPNPAFAAHMANPPAAGVARPAVPAGHAGPSFAKDPGFDAESADKQARMQARLAEDFASRTVRGGGEGGEPVISAAPVSLSKKDNDGLAFPERRKPTPQQPKRPAPSGGGFSDRRRF